MHILYAHPVLTSRTGDVAQALSSACSDLTLQTVHTLHGYQTTVFRKRTLVSPARSEGTAYSICTLSCHHASLDSLSSSKLLDVAGRIMNRAANIGDDSFGMKGKAGRADLNIKNRPCRVSAGALHKSEGPFHGPLWLLLVCAALVHKRNAACRGMVKTAVIMVSVQASHA